MFVLQNLFLLLVIDSCYYFLFDNNNLSKEWTFMKKKKWLFCVWFCHSNVFVSFLAYRWDFMSVLFIPLWCNSITITDCWAFLSIPLCEKRSDFFCLIQMCLYILLAYYFLREIDFLEFFFFLSLYAATVLWFNNNH